MNPLSKQIIDAGNDIWSKPGWWEEVPRNLGTGTEEDKPELEMKEMSQHLVGYLDLSY